MKKSNLLFTFLIFILTFLISTLSNAQYTKLLDFSDTISGSYPNSYLVSDGTFLYGMTKQGGTNNMGTIFKIKPDGTGYAKLLDFSGAANGEYPFGGLISDGTFLYGTTWYGGTSDSGTVFKIKLDGTGYSKLLDFSGTSNGYFPYCSLISDGTFLYGMTSKGGTGTCTNSCGVIFKIKLDGTGYSKLLDFAGIANGSYPVGSLISDGTFLYGTTYKGGTGTTNCSDGCGVIFKIKPDGTGYAKLHDFTGAANGNGPVGSLVSDGTFLYGMTETGGINDFGVLFKIKPDGTAYSKLLDFSGVTNGSYPTCYPISDGTLLYGITSKGGINDMGVIFKIKLDGTGYSKLFDFAGIVNGSYPVGSLISDGTFLYGMTDGGGINNMGTVFKFHPVGMDISENNVETDFTIYPNPSSGMFQIQVDSKQSKINSIEIYNVLAEKVYQSTNQQLTNSLIDISKQPNGIYFLQLKTNEGIATKKLIISH